MGTNSAVLNPWKPSEIILFSLGKKSPGFWVYHKTPAVLRTCTNTGGLSPYVWKRALLSVNSKRGLKRKAGRGKPHRFSPGSRWGESKNSHPGNSRRFQFKLDNLSLSDSLSGCL